jgi:hypothetical protein
MSFTTNKTMVGIDFVASKALTHAIAFGDTFAGKLFESHVNTGIDLDFEEATSCLERNEQGAAIVGYIIRSEEGIESFHTSREAAFDAWNSGDEDFKIGIVLLTEEQFEEFAAA